MAVTPVPTIWLSSWIEANPGGILVEKGITFAWELPAGQQAVAVQIDTNNWIFYNGQHATINVPYPDIIRILTKNAVKVGFRFKGKRKKVIYEVLPLIDPITLIIDDIILTRTNHSGSSLCTTYPTSTAVSLYTPGGYREIGYSDKYSNGKYRAVRVIIASPGQSVASCVIIPTDGGALNPNAKRTHEMMGMEACPQNLSGSFTSVTDNNGQVFYRTTLDGNQVDVKAFHDPEQDQMIVRVVSPQGYTVTANLHG